MNTAITEHDGTVVLQDQTALPVVVTSTSTVTVDVGTPTVVVSGVMGPPGINGDLSQAFAIYNKFSEIAEDEIAKQAARSNLGLATIDGGTFF